MKEISSIVGDCSYSTVNRILREEKVSIRKRGDSPNNDYRKRAKAKDGIKDIDTLISLYTNNVPVNKISEILGVPRRRISNKVLELGIKRTASMHSRDLYDDSNDALMVEMYKNGESSTEISKKLGVTHKTVQKHLKHCGITLRGNSESHFIKNGKDFPKELADFETVYDLYVVRKTSKKDMAEMFRVSPNVIDRVLREFKIRKRDSSECKIGISAGAKHPNWKGGRTALYARLREYFSTNQVKQVLKRDGYKCQLCGSKHKLQVHHIKPFKKIFEEILAENTGLDVQKDKENLYILMVNDERMNDIGNLITYCKDCHYKTHGYKRKEND